MPEIATDTDDLILTEDDNGPQCPCKPFQNLNKGYCNLAKCAYIDGIRRVRELQALPVRMFNFRFRDIVIEGNNSTLTDTASNKANENVEIEKTSNLQFSETQVSFSVLQKIEDLHEGEDGTGNTVWNSCVHWLLFVSGVARRLHKPLLEGKRVCELGCGSGMGSLGAMLAGAAEVISSDRDVTLCTRNFEAWREASGELLPYSESFRACKHKIMQYSWGEQSVALFESTPAVDVVLMSDLLYFTWYYDALFVTLETLISSQKVLPVLIVSQKCRDMENVSKFLSRVADEMKYEFSIIDSKELFVDRKDYFDANDPSLRLFVGTPPTGAAWLTEAFKPDELIPFTPSIHAEAQYNADEIFDIFDEQWNKIGQEKRGVVHANGIWHQSVNVFIFRRIDNAWEVLLQRRHTNKTVCPGHWDLSCAEHLQPDESHRQGAIRGMEEELGITGLHEISLCEFMPKHARQAEYPEVKIRDNEIVMTFGICYDGPITPDNVEVSETKWMRVADLEASINANSTGVFTPWLLLDFVSVQDGLAKLGAASAQHSGVV